MKKNIAEFIGTFALVFLGCGTILFMAGDVGLLGVSMAFGLAVVAIAYGLGPVSGAHLNPAVTLGAFFAGRIDMAGMIGYWIAQVAGGIAAAVVLYVIASGADGFEAGNFASTTIGGYGMIGALIFEFVATFLFVTVILGATQDGHSTAVAGLAIGLTLVVIHLAGITVSGSSVNPARSLATAIIAMGDPMKQIWLYIVAPLGGGALAGILHKSGITRA